MKEEDFRGESECGHFRRDIGGGVLLALLRVVYLLDGEPEHLHIFEVDESVLLL